MSDTKTDTKTLDEILAESGISASSEAKLILWNDDHNTFEWVILCLCAYLGFSPDQANKAAWNVHLKGKEIIKTGSKDSLIPYKKILEERGLTLSIEE
jgi:ATP-dependent Clp protease adaptor protein ClpS